MKASFAMVTVLAGLALATPANPAARAEAAAAAGAVEVAEVGVLNAEQEAEVEETVQALAILDPQCVSCIRKNCAASVQWDLDKSHQYHPIHEEDLTLLVYRSVVTSASPVT
ncbi:hypothetical protein Micbo1qcDRAFT_178408 [Microdochium bolleyi]|uniref:Uncharacterized protein n=1 Tax=Microdochium bolleyi TaxID=196109 RepID=A0A136ITG7_9PEZI|nr:hypothetical protein Micbo1qcDRAFT_178408 [Microdochium bolleyi]